MTTCFGIAVGLVASLAVPAARHGDQLFGFKDSRVVTTWNEIAYEIGFDPNTPTQWFSAVRTSTLTNLAVHDALNAVAPVHSYSLREREPRAHPVVAATG